MNYGIFKTMSVQEQTDYICDALDGKYVNYNVDAVREQLFAAGHTVIAHQNVSSENILTRTISELRTVSAFDMEESAESLVEALLYEKARDVAKWLASSDPRPISLNLNMREHVGKGVDTDFKEKTTDILTVVLQKDRNVTNDFGFHVKTAYPNIKHEEARFTGISFQKEAEAILRSEKNALCKGFWGLHMSGFDPFVSNKNAETKVIVPMNHGETQYALVFTNYSLPVLYNNSRDDTSKSFRDVNHPDIPINISAEANRAIGMFNKSVREFSLNNKDVSLTENTVFHDDFDR